MSQCVVNLTTSRERHLNFIARRAERRAQLLRTLFEMNHACVHPQNAWYVADISDTQGLIQWGVHNDLLTSSEIVELHR